LAAPPGTFMDSNHSRVVLEGRRALTVRCAGVTMRVGEEPPFLMKGAIEPRSMGCR
jgi:hypothetical protein